MGSDRARRPRTRLPRDRVVSPLGAPAQGLPIPAVLSGGPPPARGLGGTRRFLHARETPERPLLDARRVDGRPCSDGIRPQSASQPDHRLAPTAHGSDEVRPMARRGFRRSADLGRGAASDRRRHEPQVTTFRPRVTGPPKFRDQPPYLPEVTDMMELDLGIAKSLQQDLIRTAPTKVK